MPAVVFPSFFGFLVVCFPSRRGEMPPRRKFFLSTRKLDCVKGVQTKPVLQCLCLEMRKRAFFRASEAAFAMLQFEVVLGVWSLLTFLGMYWCMWCKKVSQEWMHSETIVGIYSAGTNTWKISKSLRTLTNPPHWNVKRNMTLFIFPR